MRIYIHTHGRKFKFVGNRKLCRRAGFMPVYLLHGAGVKIRVLRYRTHSISSCTAVGNAVGVPAFRILF